MSHLAKIQLQIKDLAALKLAASARGLELVEGAQSFKWYQGQGKCDHKLKLKDARAGSYEIGLVKSEDGVGYSMLWDDFDTSLRNAAGGRDAGALKQEYGAAVATRYYESEGFSVHRTLNSKGEIILTADK
jgi:hypothetical protein